MAGGKFARLRLRLAAFLWDYLFVAAYLALIFAAAGTAIRMLPGLGAALASSVVKAHLLGMAAVTLPVITYFSLCESSRWCATWGKRRLGIEVRRVSGERLSFGRSLARSVAKFLPWEMSHFLLWRIEGWPTAPQEPSGFVMLGFALVWMLVAANVLSVLKSHRRQALYDLIADSVVVRAGDDRVPHGRSNGPGSGSSRHVPPPEQPGCRH